MEFNFFVDGFVFPKGTKWQWKIHAGNKGEAASAIYEGSEKTANEALEQAEKWAASAFKREFAEFSR